MTNILLATDAYKLTHWDLYPSKTEHVYSYLEAREGAKFPATQFFGLQVWLKKYFEGNVLEQWMIDEVKPFSEALFGPGTNYSNIRGFQRLLDKHGGKLPIEIKAVPEGKVIPNKNVLLTVVNTDPEFPWLTNFLETLLFQACWFGSTVATQDFFIKRKIQDYAEATGGEVTPYHLHDFGYRGVSSNESAHLGGCAHLVNFLGTDTLGGILCAKEYYGGENVNYGNSVMASEHSVTCMYGQENEIDAYRAFLKASPNGIVSVVSDTYDYEHTVKNIFGDVLRDEILSREGKFVVRPDSGHPPTVTAWTLNCLWDKFGGTVNEKGFKVLNPKVGIIYGDGINYDSIGEILQAIKDAGFCTDNVVYGMGGAMLQKVHRDTQAMAFKASWGQIDGVGRNIRKTVKGQPSKASKAGKLALVEVCDTFETVTWSHKDKPPWNDNLITVFKDGEIIKEYDFNEVRKNAEKSFKNRS